MNPHQNARTTLHIRELIVTRRATGMPVARIAADFGISMRTVYKWLARFRAEGRDGLANRSSAPRSVANAWARSWIDMILDLRRRTRLTGAQIAAQLGMPRSTVAGHLAGAGLGRLRALEPKEPVRRYERARPGELIHLDVKKLGRFERPGHRVTGQRKGNRNRGAGWEHLHVAVDDASRLAYTELLADERKTSAVAFLERALAWFAGHGVTVERVMTDNGSAYRSRDFRQAIQIAGLRHIRTRPYTLCTNGKAERFIQSSLREWAYAQPFQSCDERSNAMHAWITVYNHSRPHSAFGGTPPIQRIARDNLLGNDKESSPRSSSTRSPHAPNRRLARPRLSDADCSRSRWRMTTSSRSLLGHVAGRKPFHENPRKDAQQLSFQNRLESFRFD